MGISERRAREKWQRINDILDAAEAVFAEKGFKSATMDDIAEKAELSKGTLYLYFKSKLLISIGISTRGTKKLLEYFKNAVKNQKAGLLKIHAIGQAYFQFSMDYPNYFQMMVYFEKFEMEGIGTIINEPIAQEASKTGEAVLKIIADAVQIGINDGTIRSDVNPLKTAITLWALSNGAITMHNNRGDHFKHCHNINPDFILEYFYDFIERALRP